MKTQITILMITFLVLTHDVSVNASTGKSLNCDYMLEDVSFLLSHFIL